jgi:hypothetical protein
MKCLAAVLMSVFLFGCASGTVLLISPPRNATDVAQAKIYMEAPETYEVIGIVEAFSEAGTSKEQTQNFAIGELKKQAAKIGANGVIINSIDEEQVSYSMPNSAAAYGGGGGPGSGVLAGSKTGIAVSGKAIYVHN